MFHNEIVIDCGYSGFNPVQFGSEICHPGHFFGPTIRTHWLLHYIVSGKGEFRLNGETHTLGAGDIFVIPPYTEAFYRADKQNPWHYIWIGFTTDLTLPEAMRRPVIRCAGAGSVFEDMLRCGKLENGRSAFLSAKLWELLSLLLDRGKPADYIKKAISCMQSEYMTGITVADVASRLGLDRSYFSTVFSSEVGIPPSRYLKTLRLEKAAELIAVHNERISVAGASVGYPDLYHFSKAFRGHFGLSPREYKKKYSETYYMKNEES